MTHFYWVSMPPVLRVSAPVTSKFCYLLHAWNSTRNSNQIVHRYPAREENFTGSSIFTYFFTYLLGLLWPKLFWHESWFAICLQCSSVANADAMVSPETYESFKSWNHTLCNWLTYSLLDAGVNNERWRKGSSEAWGCKLSMVVGFLRSHTHYLTDLYWSCEQLLWQMDYCHKKNNFLNKLAS